MQAESIARLQAMDIDVWLARNSASAPQSTGPRVRLSAGTGDWLLVTRGQIPERWARLVADITAVIGPERCRFGQWADSDAAGTALDELPERGIRWVLSFAGRATRDGTPAVLDAPGLETLARDAGARKALWELLSGRL